MSTLISSLVHEVTTTAGAGAQTIAAVNARRTFNVAFGTGGTNVFYYAMLHRTVNEWEYGTGHLSSATVLVRDTVIASSNANTTVTFTAGTIDVLNDLPAEFQLSEDDAALLYQLLDADLTAIAALTTTAYGRSLLTLADEDALEAVLDTLPNLTSIQGRTVTLADAGANAFFGWDDTAGAYENLTAAEAEAIIEPLIDTLANLTSIQGVTFTFGSYAATLLNNTTEAGFKAAVNLEIGVDVQAYDADLTTWAGITPAANVGTFLATPTSANLATMVTDDLFSLADAELGAIAGLTSAADKGIYFTGSGTAALFDMSSAMRTFHTTPSSANLASLVSDDLFSLADAELGAIAGLTSAADRVPYFTGLGTAALATFTATGRSIVDDASVAEVGQTLFGADPNADRILFWDDSAGAFTYLTAGTGLTITTTTITASGGSSIVTDATPPGSPADGDAWYDLDSGGFFIYVNDGTSSQWVQVGGGAGPSFSAFSTPDTSMTFTLDSDGTPLVAATLSTSGGHTFVTAGEDAVTFRNAGGATTADNAGGLVIGARTTGTAGIGFGTDLTFELENASGTDISAGRVIATYSDATAGSEDSFLTFTCRSAGAQDTVARFDADGIKFNADTAAANALDDYEEGTWSPAIQGSSSNPTVTYFSQAGTYTKIGNVLFYRFRVYINTYSGGSGDVRITLPFTISNSSATADTGSGMYTYGVDFPAGSQCNYMPSQNTSYGNVVATGDNIAQSAVITGGLAAGDILIHSGVVWI